MTTQETTRATLERAVDATRDAVSWYMEPPHRVTTSCMCGSCKALLAYGAACHALGERIGRTAALHGHIYSLTTRRCACGATAPETTPAEPATYGQGEGGRDV